MNFADYRAALLELDEIILRKSRDSIRDFIYAVMAADFLSNTQRTSLVLKAEKAYGELTGGSFVVFSVPEKSALQKRTSKVICNNRADDILFHMKDSSHEFAVGLPDILKCLKFAEREGAVPPLPPDWWVQTEGHFELDCDE